MQAQANPEPAAAAQPASVAQPVTSNPSLNEVVKQHAWFAARMCQIATDDSRDEENLLLELKTNEFDDYIDVAYSEEDTDDDKSELANSHSAKQVSLVFRKHEELKTLYVAVNAAIDDNVLIQIDCTTLKELKHRAVHIQFNRYAMDQWEEIKEQIDNDGSISQLILCGHGAGGAIASLCAVYLKKKVKVPVHVITFGSFPVVDARNVQAENQITFVNKRDPYPLVGRANEELLNHPDPEMQQLAKMIRRKWFAMGSSYEFSDSQSLGHEIDSYVKNILEVTRE